MIYPQGRNQSAYLVVKIRQEAVSADKSARNILDSVVELNRGDEISNSNQKATRRADICDILFMLLPLLMIQHVNIVQILVPYR